MDILKTHIFTSFLIACVYFIIKSLINRVYKNDKDYQRVVKKTLFKDSVLILILSYLIFAMKDQIASSISASTQVFTNEPTF